MWTFQGSVLRWGDYLLCLKLVRIMLETWNWNVSTHTNIVSENVPFNTKALLIIFLQNNSIVLKALVWEVCNRFFTSFFTFCKISYYSYWKCKFYRLWVWNSAFGLLQISHRSENLQWRHNLPTWHHRQLFWRYIVFLAKFSYCSKFHVNIIIGSGVMMTVYFYLYLSILLKSDWPEISKLEIT